MAHKVPEAVYEMYLNSSVEEMIVATEAVWDRYCNPVAFALEADAASDGAGDSKNGIGSRIGNAIKTVATMLYGIWTKIRNGVRDLVRAISRRINPTNVYKTKVGYLNTFIDKSAEYVHTLNENSLESLKDQATRNRFATKMETIREEVENARKEFAQPATDADKSQGIMNPKDTVNAAKRGLEKLDNACADALRAAKAMEKSAGDADKDAVAAANFVKTHASNAATLATSCLTAIKTVCGSTTKTAIQAERAGRKTVREMERNDAKSQREAVKNARKNAKAAPAAAEA